MSRIRNSEVMDEASLKAEVLAALTGFEVPPWEPAWSEEWEVDDSGGPLVCVLTEEKTFYASRGAYWVHALFSYLEDRQEDGRLRTLAESCACREASWSELVDALESRLGAPPPRDSRFRALVSQQAAEPRAFLMLDSAERWGAMVETAGAYLALFWAPPEDKRIDVAPGAAPRKVPRRTPLAVVIPGLLLFGLVFVGATLLFVGNFERDTTASRWLWSSILLTSSIAIVGVLLRDVVLWIGGAASRPAQVQRLGSVTGAAKWRFAPRWKEELVCTSPDGALVLEMMMGEPHVYFPTEDAWARQAPGWAREGRAELLAELRAWCTAEGVPLTVDERARVGPR